LYGHPVRGEPDDYCTSLCMHTNLFWTISGEIECSHFAPDAQPVAQIRNAAP
jgi:hypothetical protein